MRLRFAVLASVLTAFVAVATPGLASAAPRHNHGLTINATPNPIITGDPVLIYGQLNGPHHANKVIVLWHRINPNPFFTVIGITRTNHFGFYEFTREEGIVLTNRSWFVTAPTLSDNIHSRTIHERVAAAVSLAASSPTSDTNTPVTFTGHVDPAGFHVGERVVLQSQEGATGDDWRSLKAGVIDANSNYSITYRFRVPGVHDVRVAFPRDVRNIAADSDTITETIEQAQNPTFTIKSSAPLIDVGSQATINGVLYMPPPSATSTLVPDPNVSVSLWAHEDGQPFQPTGQAVNTGTDGSYSFTVMPTHNTVYQVRTTFAPPPIRHTAVLFEGVRDVVTITPSSTTSEVGQSVTFTGTVNPDKAGHVIELQRLGKDGDFHTVDIGVVDASSAYKFVWTFGAPGMHTFRTLVPGGPENVSGHSPAATITVGLPPVSSLPPAT
jgi:hypothetical protein